MPTRRQFLSSLVAGLAGATAVRFGVPALEGRSANLAIFIGGHRIEGFADEGALEHFACRCTLSLRDGVGNVISTQEVQGFCTSEHALNELAEEHDVHRVVMDPTMQPLRGEHALGGSWVPGTPRSPRTGATRPPQRRISAGPTA